MEYYYKKEKRYYIKDIKMFICLQSFIMGIKMDKLYGIETKLYIISETDGANHVRLFLKVHQRIVKLVCNTICKI